MPSGTGLPEYPTWALRPEFVMPLSYRMLQMVARVCDAGDLCGTGFLLSVQSEADPRHRWAYVVTAHHNIRGRIPQEITIEAPDPKSGGKLHPPVPIADWKQGLPGVDIAIAPFPDHPERTYLATPLETRVLPLEGLDNEVKLGSQIYYLGIFAPLDRPVARSGTIAALDQSGIPHSNGTYEFPAHLVDCRSYDGFSGSPCLVEIPRPGLLQVPPPPTYLPEVHATGWGPTGDMSYLAALCGMFTAHYDDKNQDGAVSRYGIGVMLRSQDIWEALMTDEEQARRRKWDAERTARLAAEGPQLRDAGVASVAPESEDEFQRFENLTRQLVQTPKPNH